MQKAAQRAKISDVPMNLDTAIAHRTSARKDLRSALLKTKELQRAELEAIALAYAEIGWICDLFDVEAAFLNSEMENVMYIKWPPGMVELGFMTQEEFNTTCAELKMAMYGNVDAALLWIRTLTAFLVENVE